MSSDDGPKRASRRDTDRERRDMLARLRSERPGLVEAASDKNKRRRAARRKIRAELVRGPATVPTVAAATGLPPAEVLWHFAAMRKYGELAENGQEGSYFTYRLVTQGEKQETDE